ncbi:hypothetical protein J2732_004136 [Achromobacter deleyi]|nr:hypothetical protein [Achromobacter deleyi]
MAFYKGADPPIVLPLPYQMLLVFDSSEGSGRCMTLEDGTR